MMGTKGCWKNKGTHSLHGNRVRSGNLQGLFSFYLLMLVACPSWGQVTSKKSLSPKDYHRWSSIFMPEISPNGKWVSYIKQYDYGQDTLFVNSVTNDTQFVYPGGGRLEFSSDGRKAIIKKDTLLQIQDLVTGDVEGIYPILSHELVHQGELLLIKKVYNFNDTNLIIKELKTGQVYSLKEVKKYTLNSHQNALMFTTQDKGRHTLFLLDLTSKQMKPVLLKETIFPFKQLVWGPTGKSLAFLQGKIGAGETLSLFFYKSHPKPQWFHLDPEELGYGKDSLQFSDSRLIISGDDQKLFYGTVPDSVALEAKTHEESGIVEVWNSKDRLIYPRRKKLGLGPSKPLMGVWWPVTKRTLQIGTVQHPHTVLTPDFDNAITYNIWDNEPQYKRDADLDFYITELATGKQRLLVEKLPYHGNYITMSGDGQYIKYFKNGNWWVYNVQEQDHTNLTEGLEMEWSFLDNDHPENVVVYGSPGWTRDRKDILIYDRYDLWQISLDGKKCKRLTKGREKGIKYRIYERATLEPQAHLFSSFMDRWFDVKKGLVLEGVGDEWNSGYFFLEPNNEIQTLVYKPKKIYGLKKAKNVRDYIFLEESFEEPTRLVHSRAGQPPKILADPNSFQREYAWGRASMINYRNNKGEMLKGILVYPSNYDSQQKYPMVVHIYEEQQYMLYDYVVPSEYITTHYLNTSVFAAEGYLVFYPDIRYSIGKPGESALDCVTSAVNTVVDMGVADSQRIGLYGASFGGFETTYIISQTDMFATAIAGVPVTDFVSSFLSINEKRGLDEAWRYEHHQLRMGDSFRENFKNFMTNSPVYHAASINTPLLGWVGKEDRNVHWTQSVELYLALRRLQKEHVLLVYPNEEHAILDKEKQKDLTKRIGEWMNHYLKGDPKKTWMQKEQI